MKKFFEKTGVVFLFIFTACLYFAYLGVLDLWNPDEPRYVEVAREMITLKDFIVPHLNGSIYSHKPPMFFWLIALFFSVFGEFKEWIARLVPSISAFLTVIITYFYASKIFDKKTGFFSAIILATALNMVHLAKRCNIDALFTLFILVAIVLLHLGILNKKKRTGYFLLSCLFQGIGVITKGPLAFIFPFLTLAGYAFFTNNKEIFKTAPWGRGFLVIAAVIAVWLLPAGIIGGKEYIDAIMFKHTVGRYMHGVNHPRNFFYYFYTFPLDFLPWSLFFPLIVFKGVLNRKDIFDKRLTWFFCWFLINFIFMCFSTEKRGLYLLPLFPAVAVITAYYLTNSKFENFKDFKFPFLIVTAVVALAAIAMPVVYFKKAGDINVVLTVLSAVSFWGGVFLIRFYKSFNHGFKVFLFAFIWGIAIFNVHSFLFPLANEYKSPKKFIERISPMESNWDNILLFNYYNPGFNFYLGKNHINFCNDIKTFKKYLARNIKLLIIKKQSVKDVKKFLKNYVYIKQERLGHRRFAIYMKTFAYP